MDALTLMLGCFIVTIVWALVGCVSCKRKLTDEEVQQKYFEKFRKRHILQDDTVLNSRVDFIRKASDTKKNMTVSVTTSAMNHTYEDISLDQQTKQDDNDRQDHSFFDDSFQTVVEASTASYMSNPTNGPKMQYLSVPDRASYLSLQPESSLTGLHTNTLERIQNYSQGMVNSAFSETSLAGDNQVPFNDTYLLPKCGPTIRITKPSTSKPRYMTSSCENVTGNTDKEMTEVSLSNTKTLNDSYCVHMDSFNETDIQNDEMRYRNLQKLLMEGPSFNAGTRRLSYDSSHTLYEKLKESRLDNNTYRSLTNLVIPSIKGDRPRKLTDSSKQSDHTYESITAELSNEMLRGDVNEMDVISPDAFPPEQFETPRNTGNRQESLNDLNKSPDHTYESVKSCYSIRSSGSPDLAVVIIGRRKTDLFGTKLNIENTDRYSPFPSSKKLAIKSSFKPPPSPRFSVIDTVSGGITPFRIPDSIGSLGKSCRRFSVESADLHTPEITVNDTPTVFFSPKKQYFQPSGVKEAKKQSFISPLCTYETMKARMNLRHKYLGNKTTDHRRNSLPSSSGCRGSLPSISDRRKSLPSVSDHFDTEIKVHCDLNQFSSSTPFFAMKQTLGNNI